jgi:predicted enzyme related to lactoylglutathione lyase
MLRIKYIPIFVNDIEQGVHFFTKKLGFEAMDKIEVDQTDYVPVQVNGLYLGVTLDKDNIGFKTRVILNTDDCLKDYYNMKTAGIDFNDQPKYLPIGLAAEFNDSYGNEYILLEERDYNEI